MGYFAPQPVRRFSLRPIETHFRETMVQDLMQSVLAGDVRGTQAAIDRGANPNALGVVDEGSSFGFTPLHYAVAARDDRAVAMLGAVEGSPEFRAPEMGSPLLFAVSLKDPDMLRALLDITPLRSLTESTQQQIWFESARRNAPNCLKLLAREGMPVDIRDAAGYTLLLRSIEMNELDLTSWLLDNGARVDIMAINGMTPGYSIQYELENQTPRGSPKEERVRGIIDRMTELGAKFPARDPAECMRSSGSYQ